MNLFLLISGGKRGSRSVDLVQTRVFLPLMISGLLLSALFVVAGFMLGKISGEELRQSGVNSWHASLQQSREDIKRISQQATDDIDALALRLGQMEARAIRLDALGSRLINVAGLGAEEFDFLEAPAVGGPETVTPLQSIEIPSLMERFSDLQRQIDDRAHKFALLESIMMDRELEKQVLPNGRPVEKGWMSSKYGRRSDPFSGKSSWHAGVDFAGKLGSGVVSVASGVVTWSGNKKGFGLLIEISHGNGYLTRYAHNSASLVKVGETVEKGSIIAKMGSSGRSTGPHVHFEVLKDNKAVNPAKYIKNASAR